MNRGIYNIILASPEALLGPRSWFWQHILRNKKNKFQYCLVCNAINKAHIIWSWQNFWEEYQILGNLKNVFLTILICLLSATITPNIREYIWVLLKLSQLLQIYKQLLDCPNRINIVSPIYKTRFEDLDFLIPSEGAIGKIPKIIIFVKKIDDAIQMAKQLQSRFSGHIRREKHPNHIIRIYTTNLTTTLRTKFLTHLCLDETQI